MNSVRRDRSKLLVRIIMGAIVLMLMFCVGKPEERQELQADLNYNGIKEDYSLYQHHVLVCEDGKTIWQSPEAWQVDQIVIGDVTNDGNQELVLLLWKQGSYGPVQPFWVTGDDVAWTNHLFVYALVGDHLKTVWCSSSLSQTLTGLQIIADSQNGNYLAARKNRFGFNNTIYLKWNDWGFEF